VMMRLPRARNAAARSGSDPAILSKNVNR
jgi:hypothetical protein